MNNYFTFNFPYVASPTVPPKNNPLSTINNYYELLGVHPRASVGEIREQYLKLMKIYHTDKNAAGQKMAQIITRAYNTLKDQQKRAHYNQTGEDGNDHSASMAFASNYAQPVREIVMAPLSEVFKDNGQTQIFLSMQEIRGLNYSPYEPVVQRKIQELCKYAESFALEHTVVAFKKAMETGFACAKCGRQLMLNQLCYCAESAHQCHCNERRCCRLQKTGRTPDFV